jgi:hypothetical protein
MKLLMLVLMSFFLWSCQLSDNSNSSSGTNKNFTLQGSDT